MPKRWISESICDSPNFNILSAEAEVHWGRCLVLTDDYGCYQSTLSFLKGHAYPLKEVTSRDILARQVELLKAGIILSWTADDGRDFSVFAAFPRFNYPQARHARKTPKPPQNIIDELLREKPELWADDGSPLSKREQEEKAAKGVKAKPKARPSEKTEFDKSTIMDPVYGSMVKAYEDNIGMLTPMLAERIKKARDEYPEGWFAKAVQEAVTHNKRNLSYVEKILERWKVEGMDPGKAWEKGRTLKYQD